MNETMASHREFVLVYMQYDESLSIMSAVNRQYLTGNDRLITTTSTPSPTTPESYGNSSIWEPQVTNLMSTGQLNTTQAPTFSALNGLIFANNAPFEMCANDPTIWYVSAFGDNPHVFHMHGNGFMHGGDNMASISTSYSLLYPELSGLFLADLVVTTPNHFSPMTDLICAIGINDGEMKTLTSSMTALGQWDLICHVGNHLSMGMLDTYIVYPPESCPLPKLAKLD